MSHETISRSLFVHARGSLHRTNPGGQLSDMVLLSERPAEAEDRSAPGHWEGDLIIGKGSLSAIGTLVERQTRFVMLIDLRLVRPAGQVADALAVKVGELPDHLRRSLTWDRGKEMVTRRHRLRRIGVAADVPPRAVLQPALKLVGISARSPRQLKREGVPEVMRPQRAHLPAGISDLAVMHAPDVLQDPVDGPH